EPLLGFVAREKLAAEPPEIVDRRLHAAVAFLGAVPEPKHPFAAVADVIHGLLGDARRDGGELAIARRFEAGREVEIEDVEEILAHDRPGEVAVRLLDEKQVSE